MNTHTLTHYMCTTYTQAHPHTTHKHTYLYTYLLSSWQWSTVLCRWENWIFLGKLIIKIADIQHWSLSKTAHGKDKLKAAESWHYSKSLKALQCCTNHCWNKGWFQFLLVQLVPVDVLQTRGSGSIHNLIINNLEQTLWKHSACPYSEEWLFLYIISISLSSTQSLLWVSSQELQGWPMADGARKYSGSCLGNRS